MCTVTERYHIPTNKLRTSRQDSQGKLLLAWVLVNFQRFEQLCQNLIINACVLRSCIVITALGKHSIPGFTRIPATVLETYSDARVCADSKEEMMRKISRNLIVGTFTISATVKFQNLVVREDVGRWRLIRRTRCKHASLKTFTLTVLFIFGFSHIPVHATSRIFLARKYGSRSIPPKIERKMSCRCSKKDDFTELAAESSTKERIRRMYRDRISEEVFSLLISPIGTYKPGTARTSIEPVIFALRLIESNL